MRKWKGEPNPTLTNSCLYIHAMTHFQISHILQHLEWHTMNYLPATISFNTQKWNEWPSHDDPQTIKSSDGQERKKKERKQNKTLVQNIFDFIYTTEGSLLPYFLFVMWSTHYTSDNYVEEILTENFHLSPKFCSSTSRCSLPWITSIVFCLVLSCSKWFPPLLCRLAIFFLVVP